MKSGKGKIEYYMLDKIKRVLILLVVIWGCAVCSPSIPEGYNVHEGDFVFQSLPHSDLVDAIEGITQSPYSHCGIVEKKNGDWYVIEALGSVHETEISQWIQRGRDGHFVAYRLNKVLEVKTETILDAAREYFGRPYDIHYEFDDEKIYCSELIFKAVKKATGIELGKVQTIAELNWKPYEVVALAIEGRMPLERRLITPKAITEAKELIKIYDSESNKARVPVTNTTVTTTAGQKPHQQ